MIYRFSVIFSNTVDYDIIWDICTDDIPELIDFCNVQINEQSAELTD